jgi:hypothetical protein
MSTIPQEPSKELPERRRSTSRFFVREMWASLAIAVIWLAVLFSAVFGSDLVTNNAGTNVSTVPSAVVVALFASLATWAVAKCGFGRRGDDAD